MELRNFYKFFHLDNLDVYREKLLDFGNTQGIKGTVLLAPNGINAAICATDSNSLKHTQEFIENTLNIQCSPLITKLDDLDSNALLPFKKYKVKIKESIVAFGIEGLDPSCSTATQVAPKHWNELISDPKTITIDTRNIYEYLIGHFKEAINPNTPNFRDFADFVLQFKESHSTHDTAYDKIAMYCTGGIRCEMASSYLISKNIKNTYQLEGGILNYFQKVPQSQSLWEGACFVFDDRIAIDNAMKPSRLNFNLLPKELHREKNRNRHTGHVYKKIMSITQE